MSSEVIFQCSVQLQPVIKHTAGKIPLMRQIRIPADYVVARSFQILLAVAVFRVLDVFPDLLPDTVHKVPVNISPIREIPSLTDDNSKAPVFAFFHCAAVTSPAFPPAFSVMLLFFSTRLSDIRGRVLYHIPCNLHCALTAFRCCFLLQYSQAVWHAKNPAACFKVYRVPAL